jgi:DNA-binding MarR family transcriptional regulator
VLPRQRQRDSPGRAEDQLAVWKQLQWATALITSRFRRDLAAAGLSLEQFDVLVHLAWAPSETLPLHELTASMVVADALSRSDITRLLDRMERDGLITRTVSTTDRRRFDVSLTTPGRQRFDQAWPAHADGIGRYFAQPLAPRDIGELARILDNLIQANQNHDQPG